MNTAFNTYSFLFCILNVANVYCGSGKQGDYSNEWLLQADLSPQEVQNLAKNYGLEYSHEVVRGFYVLKLPSPTTVTNYYPVGPCILSSKQKQIMDHPKVKSLRQQQYLSVEERGRVKPKTIKIKDDSWPEMWYLHRDRVPSMNVYEAWELGYSGKGVQVAVLDDGIDMGHPDLMGNYLSEYSYDYLYDNNYPIHNGGNFHGTFCAGIISAVKNKECIVGVAYNSKFSALKVHDSYFGLTPAAEAMALIHELSHFDLYSVSLGPPDDGRTFEATDDVINAAFQKGVTVGRNGNGAIYMWAAGNGGSEDNCNCDGFVGSIYAIAITSISMDLEEPWYAERCTSIMAGTYGGDEPNPAVSTTNTNGGCANSFQGTSATCPMATGIIALALEANPDLTWRDVQYLVVETSSHDNLNHSTSLSGAGRKVNHYFGFGLMNAVAMINKSLTWKTVPDQVVCQSENIIVNGLSINGSNVTSKHMSDGCSNTVRYLEHVQARVVVQTVKRGALEIFLTSPSGLASQLLTRRPYDYDRNKLDWTFMTVHHWGENPTGEWQLRVQITEPNILFQVFEWQLVFYGTSTDPTLGRIKAEEQISAKHSSTTGAIVGGSVSGVAWAVVFIATIADFIYCRL